MRACVERKYTIIKEYGWDVEPDCSGGVYPSLRMVCVWLIEVSVVAATVWRKRVVVWRETLCQPWSTLGVVHILALRIPFTRMWTNWTTWPVRKSRARFYQ
jgi:hypothetical protein